MHQERKLNIGDPLVRRIVRTSWPEFKGRKVSLRVAEEYHLSSYTSEDSQFSYEWKALDLAEFRVAEIPQYDGLSAHVAGPGSLQWKTAFEATRVLPNVAYVGWVRSWGKSLMIEIVIHPDNAAKLLEGGE